MATIHLTALSRVPGYGGGGGPDVECGFHPRVSMQRIFGEDKPEVPVLWLTVGNDSIRVWPADPDRIEELGQQLIEIAQRERERREGARR